jgi:hypothetical protein
MKRRLLVTILLLFVLTAGVLCSDEVWEGNATQIRRGEFETEGLFAASNSFPKGTVVEVQNIRSGKSVQVTVLKRIGDNPNLFLLLSYQAARELGINSGDVERVRVRIVPDFGSDVYPRSEELTSSQDPDINPNVGVPESPPAEAEVVQEKGESAAETAIVETGISEAAEEKRTPEEQLIVEKASRDPQKMLYTSPREGESSISPEVETPEEEVVKPGIKEPRVEEVVEAEAPETTVEPPRPEKEALIAIEPTDPVPPEKVGAIAVEEGEPEETLEPPQAEQEYGIAFRQEDPDLPREMTPETGVEPPEVGIGEEVAFSPSDPSLPQETEEGKPSASIDPPQPRESYLVAFSPSDPLLPEEEAVEAGEQPEATVEPPEIEVGEETAFVPGEPLPPGEAEEKGPEGVLEEEVAGVTEPEPEEPKTEEETPKEVTPEVVTRVEEEVAVAEEKPAHEKPAAALKTELTGDLKRGRVYFVQLGAYSDEALARSLEAIYSKDYPIEIYAAKSGERGIYRVLVGPLSKDESGAVLYWFKARGFKDAFVRSTY